MGEGYPGDVGEEKKEDDYYDNDEPVHGFFLVVFWISGFLFWEVVFFSFLSLLLFSFFFYLDRVLWRGFWG